MEGHLRKRGGWWKVCLKRREWMTEGHMWEEGVAMEGHLSGEEKMVEDHPGESVI